MNSPAAPSEDTRTPTGAKYSYREKMNPNHSNDRPSRGINVKNMAYINSIIELGYSSIPHLVQYVQH